MVPRKPELEAWGLGRVQAPPRLVEVDLHFRPQSLLGA